MLDRFGDWSQSVTNGLALFGAITLLLTLYVVGLVIRVSKATDKGVGTEAIAQELNRQILMFSLLLAGVMGLVLVGVPLSLALGAAFVGMLFIHRWLLKITIALAVGAGLFYLVHFLFS